MSLTNQELMQEIKDMRKEHISSHKDLQGEIRDLKREFYLFKGKAFAFIGMVGMAINFAIEYAKRKM